MSCRTRRSSVEFQSGTCLAADLTNQHQESSAESADQCYPMHAIERNIRHPGEPPLHPHTSHQVSHQIAYCLEARQGYKITIVLIAIIWKFLVLDPTSLCFLGRFIIAATDVASALPGHTGEPPLITKPIPSESGYRVKPNCHPPFSRTSHSVSRFLNDAMALVVERYPNQTPDKYELQYRANGG